jgi:hypothetical protein
MCTNHHLCDWPGQPNSAIQILGNVPHNFFQRAVQQHIGLAIHAGVAYRSSKQSMRLNIRCMQALILTHTYMVACSHGKGKWQCSQCNISHGLASVRRASVMSSLTPSCCSEQPANKATRPCRDCLDKRNCDRYISPQSTKRQQRNVRTPVVCIARISRSQHLGRGPLV